MLKHIILNDLDYNFRNTLDFFKINEISFIIDILLKSNRILTNKFTSLNVIKSK
jgi:hypothetical protein